jgi:FG-GAP-like repeat
MVFNVLNPRPDFNGDGKTDVFWRNDVTNQNAVWLMNGTQVQRASFLPSVAEEAGWRETKLGDFNGDGKTDIFWRNAATGQNAIWLMDGDRIASAQFIAGADGNWQADIGDFNGDGRSDFFWHNKATGQTAAWVMNSFTIQDARFLPNVPPEWESFVAEFNRDGKTDLFWRNSRTGENAVWTMNGARLATGQFGHRIWWIWMGMGDRISCGQIKMAAMPSGSGPEHPSIQRAASSIYPRSPLERVVFLIPMPGFLKSAG